MNSKWTVKQSGAATFIIRETSGSRREIAEIHFGESNRYCPRNEAHANAAFIVRACNAHEELLDLLKSAIARIELANKEGDNILSAWLPDARAAVARAEGGTQ